MEIDFNLKFHPVGFGLFSSGKIGNFRFVYDYNLCSRFESKEDINCTSEGAPSKRIGRIYESMNKKYNKVSDAVDIIELSGIETILEKCPRFKNWVEKLIIAVAE